MTRDDTVPRLSATDDTRPAEPAPTKRRPDTVLEASIRTGDLAVAASLLRSGADANRRGPEGLTPLMIASGLGQPQMVDLLLTAGADVLEVEPRMGTTALHKAAQSGNADVIGLLLDHGSFIGGRSPVLGNGHKTVGGERETREDSGGSIEKAAAHGCVSSKSAMCRRATSGVRTLQARSSAPLQKSCDHGTANAKPTVTRAKKTTNAARSSSAAIAGKPTRLIHMVL